ncbi:MAG: phosphoribosylanthranilate isomerase [Candidatus Omnitrophota bacterium]|nr:phosphoribosylanthranilate isomerase [Candidatus Omnitrophota bacterium]MBU1928870.1 phosphoribosylanthranilate isomerase [Candidatus Omnitrophota bacterium]MBU2034480.1 phosphoribosylanthranilate isomerase [Candidatus Omnitrophota bacterium]MBU2258627.1 phosphoribosylanthranilate isomerase [Candidatus Omnitrophota bacterium]
MVKVKICGITNLEDALTAVNAGCDALGFMFYKKSPRYISPLKASSIIRQLPEKIIKIGVFVNSTESFIRKTAKICKLNLLQFHGDETPEFCAKFKDKRVIKAFRVKGVIGPEEILKYNAFAYLFDTYTKSGFGGSGKVFNWKFVQHPECITRPIFLSGGLTEKNVCQAIKTFRPHWVDVSSGVEKLPGKKDQSKVRKFIKAVKK